MELFNAIRFKGCKAFLEDTDICLDHIGKVNVIVEKDNSGETMLADIIESAYNGFDNNHDDNYSGIDCRVEIPFMEIHLFLVSIRLNFLGNRRRAEQYNLTDPSHLLELFNKAEPYYIDKIRNEYLEIRIPEMEWNGSIEDPQMDRDFRSDLSLVLNILLSRKTCIRLSSNRNIVAEDVKNEFCIRSDGTGASNIVREIINNSIYPESLIEQTILTELNKIIGPETEYERIQIQEIEDQNRNIKWEIFLTEKGQTRIALSKCGGGLKSILLVLFDLYVVPYFMQEEGIYHSFIFEELENHLDPAMQKRLFEYLYQYAKDKDVSIFLTTHSTVAISAFYGRDDVVFYHVIKTNGKATVEPIVSYSDVVSVLNDLGAKGSDLLQSNGIIWVEGPTDQIYIKRWLEIFTENKYVEGRNYQFVYYGGKNLFHYDAGADNTDGSINMLKINHNAVIVIDSDCVGDKDKINATKQRLVDEFNEHSMMFWITKGKEIENYLTKETISKKFEKEVSQCGQYELFPDYIKEAVGYKNFKRHKREFAENICPYIDDTDILDLREQITELYKQIENWNS